MAREVPGTEIGRVIDVRVLSGERIGEQLLFFDQDQLRFGRNAANDVVLPDGAVSRFHASLRGVEGGYELLDEGSTSGTFLTGGAGVMAVEAKTPTILALPGQVDIGFGRGGPRVRLGLGLSVEFGRYRLIGRLGGGGMAEVFLARQTGLGGFSRSVAMKLIQPEMFELVDATSMFLDEARIAAEINHHNVVKIYDVGEQNGVLYLAMEHLRGVTLSHMSAQLSQRGEQMPPDLVAALLSQACAGLHAAHTLRDPSGRALNVVHRDVSPSNLMMTSEGLVKVIDFGVARADLRLVRKEQGLQGKPAYMSPEQIQAQPLDGRSDVFAMGVVLYELCTGQPLFQREDMVATFYAVVKAEVPPLRTLCGDASPLLETIAKKALAKDPAQRFQSAQDLAAELDQVVLEAGGRFANITAVARFLGEWGINLHGAPPTLLTAVPKPLLRRKKRISEGGAPPVTSESAPRAPAVVPVLRPTLPPPSTIGEPVVAAGGQSPDQAASVPPPSGAARVSAVGMQPLLRKPQRLEGVLLDGRYRIRRWMGATAEAERPYPKLLYLAEATQDGPAEQQARTLGLLDGRDVQVVICGRGPEVQALPGVQRAKLKQWIAKRMLGPCPAELLPILASGELPTLSSSYLVFPQCRSTLQALLDAGPLPAIEEALLWAERVLLSVKRAHEVHSGFVHGSLSPASFVVSNNRGGPEPSRTELASMQDRHRSVFVLQDFHLETLLGAPLGAIDGYPTVRSADSLYLAPERALGEPVSVEADLYSVGAILYRLLGGDLPRATQATRAGRELPRLPVSSALSARADLMILSALGHDPAQRPSLSALLGALTEQSAAEADPVARAGILRLAPPPALGPHPFKTPGGRVLRLTTVSLPVSRQHVQVALPFSAVPDLLPAPVYMNVHGATLTAEVDLNSASRSKDRPSLYHDAYEPGSRCETYTLLPTSALASFDVGHRRTKVQRIHYASTISSVPTIGERLALTIPEIQLCIETPAPHLRLTVLYITEGGDGPVHVVCLLLTPPERG